LTIPGAYAEKLQDVPKLPDVAKKALMDNPSKGKTLRDLLAATTYELYMERQPKKRAAASMQSALTLSFSDTDEEPVAPPPKKVSKATMSKLVSVGTALLECRITEGMSGAKAAKVLKKAKDLATTVEELVSEAGGPEAISPDKLDLTSIRSHTRMLGKLAKKAAQENS
jgi:hypothetical protein